jgi:hypothetical protein
MNVTIVSYGLEQGDTSPPRVKKCKSVTVTDHGGL